MYQKISIFYLLIIFFAFSSKAQNIDYSTWKNIDTVANMAFIDSINYLNRKAKEVNINDRDLALKYSTRALKLSLNIRYLNGLADSYNNLGIIYKNIGDYSRSLSYQLKSLKLKMINGDKRTIARSYNNVALVYDLKNDLLKSLEYHFQSLKLKEEINDERGLAVSLGNIGLIYSKQNNHKSAINYFFKALRIDLKYRDSLGVSFDYKNIGIEYYNIGSYEKAKEYQERALAIKLLLNSVDKELSNLYNNLANIEAEFKNYIKALEYYRKSLNINYQTDDKEGVSIAEANIGSLLIDLKKFKESEFHLNKSLQLSKEIGAIGIQTSVYELLMKLNEKLGNCENAYKFSKLYKKISDQSAQSNNFEKLNELGIKYETDKKEKEIKLLNKDKDLKNIEISHQKSVRNYFIGLAVIILASTFFIFRLYQNKQKDNVLLQEQKAEIEIQKKSITDSINYAYRIQKSILPSQEHFYEILPQSFVFNRPKDIVSGDFYWLHETSPFKYSSVNSKVLLALADCTGHGVPGAFMSMMGVELLNEAVNESHSPAKIMQIVDEGIRKALHTNNLESKKDGMDMSLCAFDFEKNTMKYCGANRPIYRIRNGILDIVLPQKTAVGFSEPGFVFENREMDIQKEDCIYLFSDGYADQFGGQKDKKLTTKKFKDLLMSLQAIPIREQGEELGKFINEWAGSASQVDDMLVIGIRV